MSRLVSHMAARSFVIICKLQETNWMTTDPLLVGELNDMVSQILQELHAFEVNRSYSYRMSQKFSNSLQKGLAYESQHKDTSKTRKLSIIQCLSAWQR